MRVLAYIVVYFFPIPLHVAKVAIYRAKADVVTVEKKTRGLIQRQEPYITICHTLITLTRGQPSYIIC